MDYTLFICFSFESLENRKNISSRNKIGVFFYIYTFKFTAYRWFGIFPPLFIHTSNLCTTLLINSNFFIYSCTWIRKIVFSINWHIIFTTVNPLFQLSSHFSTSNKVLLFCNWKSQYLSLLLKTYFSGYRSRKIIECLFCTAKNDPFPCLKYNKTDGKVPKSKHDFYHWHSKKKRCPTLRKWSAYGHTVEVGEEKVWYTCVYVEPKLTFHGTF